MSHLNCSVTSCYAYKQNYCCLPTIKVEGSSATSPKETICASYRKKGESQNSSASQVSEIIPQVDVGCAAVVCMYNEHGKCSSQQVDIVCNCGCGDRSECATFRQ